MLNNINFCQTPGLWVINEHQIILEVKQIKQISWGREGNNEKVHQGETVQKQGR